MAAENNPLSPNCDLKQDMKVNEWVHKERMIS